MNKKNIIYTLTTSLALALGSCASEDFWDTFDRTVDGPIDFTVGVESSPAERSLTRAITPKYTSLAKGTQVRIRVNGDWVKKTPNTTVSQTATCVTNEAKEVNSLSYDNNTLYWDDYGVGDPANIDNRNAGVNVLGVAVDGMTTAPAIDDDSKWTTLPWNVITNGENVLNGDIIISKNLTAYKFAERGDAFPDAKKMIFTHPLSKITFNIKAGDGFTTGIVGATEKKFDKDPILTLSKATTLAGIETEANNYALATGSVSISGGTATSDSKTSKVIAGTVSTSDLAVTVIKQAIVYPGTQLGANSSDIIAVLQADDNVYYINASEIHTAIDKFKMEHGIIHTEYKTLPGYNYIVNIIVNKSCLILTASITDWVSVNSDEVNPEININTTVGGGGDSELKNIKKFTFWRSTKIDSGYDNVAQPEVKDDGSLDWTKTNVLYWTHHKQHYHFRGIYPLYDVNNIGPKVEEVGGKQCVHVENGAYNASTFPSNFVIGMPEIASGSMCGNPDHKDEEVDMSVGGICARRVPINLNFRYMMSQVEVNLKSESNDANAIVDLTDAQVEFVNVYNTGKILLKDRSAEVTGNADNFILPVFDATKLQYLGVIVPQGLTYSTAGASTNVRIKITLKNGDVYYADMAPIKVKASGESTAKEADSWASGVHYKYNLNITKTEIKATATLTDWQTVEASEDVWF